MAVVEYARNVCGFADAYSTEFKPDCKNPVIHLMAEQKAVSRKGGTMRLGAYPCTLTKGTFAQKAYGATEISERHRHPTNSITHTGRNLSPAAWSFLDFTRKGT